MKFDTLTDYPQTAEVWTVVNQDEHSGGLTYAYDRIVPCKFVTQGRSSTLLADVGLTSFQQIRAVKDANGVELNPGVIYTVKGLSPVTNVFGFVEQMSYLLTGGK